MQYIYFGTLLAAMIVFLLCALLLFLQRNKGERSRRILAGMSLLSVVNYIGLIVFFFINSTYSAGSTLDIPFLLLGIFVMAIYLIYPVEVISPGWITGRRLLKMYLPVVVLILLYHITLWLGVKYTSYMTLAEMIRDIGSFQVILRIVLMMLIFLPVMFLYHVPYTRRYNNTDHKWMRGYITGMAINMVAYLVVNVYNTYLSCSLYVAISVMCSLYFTYQELFVRLIRKPMTLPQAEEIPSLHVVPQVGETKNANLYERLEHYMNSTKGWQNPDLSVKKVISDLYTNRTALLKAVKLYGFSGYPAYVNNKRVEEFIQITLNQGGFNYQQTFFDVGFRSKRSALRNFKESKGMTPSEYFQKHQQKK